jgi:hypothetical protein|tara:strand:+ start:280 stop:399 length:120 start_codon:yes stop_codon:yes gene_type:complete
MFLVDNVIYLAKILDKQLEITSAVIDDENKLEYFFSFAE